MCQLNAYAVKENQQELILEAVTRVEVLCELQDYVKSGIVFPSFCMVGWEAIRHGQHITQGLCRGC